MAEVVGVILAGGAGRRMGGPKADIAMPDGRTMLEHVAATLERLCPRVVISGDAASRPDLDRIADTRVGLGPLGGIATVLAEDLGERCLVCPCDMPDVAPDRLAPLLAADAPVAALRVRGEPHARPLPLRIDRVAAGHVTALIDAERYAVRGLLDHPALAVIEIDDDTGLRNVNTPADLA